MEQYHQICNHGNESKVKVTSILLLCLLNVGMLLFYLLLVHFTEIIEISTYPTPSNGDSVVIGILR